MGLLLVETKTLGAAASSVEFTSIPQNADDLLFVISARSSQTIGNSGHLFTARPNGSTSNLTFRALVRVGNSISNVNLTTLRINQSASDQLANSFGIASMYISNYKLSANKSVNIQSGAPNSTTAASHLTLGAGSWDNSSAITSMTFVSSGGNFQINSVFSLYKITKGSDGIVTVS